MQLFLEIAPGVYSRCLGDAHLAFNRLFSSLVFNVPSCMGMTLLVPWISLAPSRQLRSVVRAARIGNTFSWSAALLRFFRSMMCNRRDIFPFTCIR